MLKCHVVGVMQSELECLLTRVSVNGFVHLVLEAWTLPEYDGRAESDQLFEHKHGKCT